MHNKIYTDLQTCASLSPNLADQQAFIANQDTTSVVLLIAAAPQGKPRRLRRRKASLVTTVETREASLCAVCLKSQAANLQQSRLQCQSLLQRLRIPGTFVHVMPSMKENHVALQTAEDTGCKEWEGSRAADKCKGSALRLCYNSCFRRKCLLLAACHQNTKAVPCTPAPYRNVEAEAFNLHLITPVSFCEYPNQGRRVL